MEKPVMIYWSPLTMFSTIRSEDGNGCMLESGEPDIEELYNQINTVKPLGVTGTRSIPMWSRSRKDRNVTPFLFIESKDKFTIKAFNPFHMKAEIVFIKAWCGKDKKDEYQGDLFDACLAKSKYQVWNPWFRNIEGVNGWYKISKGMTKIRQAYIDFKLSYYIPLIKQGYKIKIGLENEPPLNGINALTESLRYIITKLKDADLNPYKIIVPGIDFVPEALQKITHPYGYYKRGWAKKQVDWKDKELRSLARTVHNWNKSQVRKGYEGGRPESIPYYPRIIGSLDGWRIVLPDGTKRRPNEQEVFEVVYPLFKLINEVARKYTRIIANQWVFEFLGWGTGFDGSNIKGIIRAWEEAFGDDLSRPNFKKLIWVNPDPEPVTPEPATPEPIKPDLDPIEPDPGQGDKKMGINFKGFFTKTWAWLDARPKFSWWTIGILSPFVAWLILAILFKGI